jgi:AmmeMemoRadiSam system protein A
MDINLSQECRSDLLQFVRQTILDALTQTEAARFSRIWPILKQSLGLFVTIHKNSQLRGCIGYIEGFQPLQESLKELALSAAFRDPRFKPLTRSEFADITIEMTILSKPEQVDRIGDIAIGKHGLVISKKRKRGLLLPQVALEYGWNVEEFLQQTCIKAGLKADDWQHKDTMIEKFQGYIFSE